MHEYGAGSTGHISVYGPAHNPWDIDPLPGRLLERPGRRGRRAAGRGRGRRRRDRLDPLPRRLLRDHRAEADLRPLGDGGAPDRRHDDDRLRARCAPTRPTAGCSARRCSASRSTAGDAAGLRIGIVRRARRRGLRPRGHRARASAAIEALASETGGELVEIEIEGLEHAHVASILVGTTEDLGGPLARPRRGARRGDEPDRKGAAQVPLHAAGGGGRARRTGRARWCAARSPTPSARWT